MKSLLTNTGLKNNLLLLLPVLIALWPIFATDYFISFDGPFHLYNSRIFNDLISGDTFMQQFYQLNPSPTPNYLALLTISALMTIFNAAWAYKIFHLILIICLFVSFWSWHGRFTKNSALLFLPFLFSALFFNGFYNFVFAFVLLFLTLKHYEFTKKRDLKFYITIGLLLAATYFSHSIVFLFLGLTLLHYEVFMLIIRKQDFKKTLMQLSYLFLCSLPCLLLAYFFVSNRAAEVNYLEAAELLKRLFTGYAIYTREAYLNTYKTIFICSTYLLTVLLAIYRFRNKTFETSDYFLFTAFTTLILYFVLPDSVGYASVFSVRIEYFFWILIISWISRNMDIYQPIKIAFLTLFLIFGSVQIFTNFSYWKKLDHDAQKLLEAGSHISNKTLVYPIFASNTWEHSHISNLLGAEKNILLLENSSAKNGYFPVLYKSQFEKQLETNPGLQITEGEKRYNIDYVLKVGKSTFNSAKDEVIYNSAKQKGKLVFQNELVELWALPKETSQ